MDVISETDAFKHVDLTMLIKNRETGYRKLDPGQILEVSEEKVKEGIFLGKPAANNQQNGIIYQAHETLLDIGTDGIGIGIRVEGEKLKLECYGKPVDIIPSDPKGTKEVHLTNQKPISLDNGQGFRYLDGKGNFVEVTYDSTKRMYFIQNRPITQTEQVQPKPELQVKEKIPIRKLQITTPVGAGEPHEIPYKKIEEYDLSPDAGIVIKYGIPDLANPQPEKFEGDIPVWINENDKFITIDSKPGTLIRIVRLGKQLLINDEHGARLGTLNANTKDIYTLKGFKIQINVNGLSGKYPEYSIQIDRDKNNLLETLITFIEKRAQQKASLQNS